MDVVYRHYTKLEHIGKDGFGEVYKCHDNLNKRTVALKWIPFIEKNDGLPSLVLREISMLKDLDHGNVLRLLDVDVPDKEDGLYVVFEYLDIDLADFLILHRTRKTEVGPHVIKSFLFQILQGVFYCHSQKVLHRDLKSRNMLIDLKNGTVKLADFGFSRTFDVPLPEYTKEIGTCGYRAPEILLNIPDSTACDIWSVGVIFSEMVRKVPLFTGTTQFHNLISIFRLFGVPDEADWPELHPIICDNPLLQQKLPAEPTQSLANLVPGLEPQGIDLLSKMLCMNPNRRITAQEALKHPYFSNVQQNIGPLLF